MDVWSHDNWLNEAKERRDKYLMNGSSQAAIWVLTEGRTIPKGAILVGREHSWNLYICRAFHDVHSFQFCTVQTVLLIISRHILLYRVVFVSFFFLSDVIY